MDAVVKATLEWCNELRAGKGMEPLDDLPKGVRKDHESCPCGKATGAYVAAYNWCWPDSLDWPLPSAVCEFVRRFDRGEYPQYDIEATA